MVSVLIATLGVGFLLMFLERLFPAQPLPKVRGWWTRVIVINCFQAAIVIAGGFLWERWFESASLFKLSNYTSTWVSAFIAYLVITFVYYWWHRARHDISFLWLTLHQVHHSPSRIETITSFFKHPLEILINSILITIIIFGILGINRTAGQIVTVITCYAEFFYHMNLKTPFWAGFFIQRPEMHRFHHQVGRHYNNFADLPIWDFLFGTYFNPKSEKTNCGFLPAREKQFWNMIQFKDVNKPRKKSPS